MSNSHFKTKATNLSSGKPEQISPLRTVASAPSPLARGASNFQHSTLRHDFSKILSHSESVNSLPFLCLTSLNTRRIAGAQKMFAKYFPSWVPLKVEGPYWRVYKAKQFSICEGYTGCGTLKSLKCELSTY